MKNQRTLDGMETGEYIWHSPLLQAVATLRGSGQIFCANECQKLFTLLHTYDPTERSEYLIAYRLIAKAEESKTDSTKPADNAC